MSRDLFLKVGCLLGAALLIMTVAGCGKKGDPRPPAPVTTIEDSTGIQYSSYTEESTCSLIPAEAGYSALQGKSRGVCRDCILLAGHPVGYPARGAIVKNNWIPLYKGNDPEGRNMTRGKENHPRPGK